MIAAIAGFLAASVSLVSLIIIIIYSALLIKKFKKHATNRSTTQEVAITILNFMQRVTISVVCSSVLSYLAT